jgi:uncharacterized glyoxalase superfamily protein PhnB
MVRDLQASIAFYQNILGFSIRMAVDDEKNILVTGISPETKFIYAQLEKDGVEIMIQQQSSMVEDLPVFSGCDICASVTFYMIVEDIDELFQQVRGKADCIRELGTSWYGMREFYIRDLDGYILGFAEQQTVSAND